MEIDIKKFKEDYPNMTNNELMKKYNIKYVKLMKMKTKFNLSKNPKYYYFNAYHNDWRIHKGGVYYSALKTEEEAKKIVELLKKNNWDKESVQKYIPHSKPKYKFYNYDKRNNTWRIEKGGEWFGAVKSEEEAKKVVKFLKRNNWDKELFEKYKNEIFNEE